MEVAVVAVVAMGMAAAMGTVRIGVEARERRTGSVLVSVATAQA